MKKSTEVAAASLVRQAVLNTSSSVELFREAVSNSVDAGASYITIDLHSDGGDLWDLVIEDDGHGMAEAHLEAFFDAGKTVKDTEAKSEDDGKPYLAIGEKGLGSKTTFVAEQIVVESVRDGISRVGIMEVPMQALDAGRMPTYLALVDPSPEEHGMVLQEDHGTRVHLRRVHIPKFNGMPGDDAERVVSRLMHYLRTLCATGTVKLRHAMKTHVKSSVIGVSVSPDIVVTATRGGQTAKAEAVAGYPVPQANPAPTDGPIEDGIARNSYNFADVLDFSGSKTVSLGDQARTVHYDGTAIIAGPGVRNEMLAGELKPGWTHKSQMGVHLCKDFVPLRNDTSLSRELLGGEYYFDFKVFINSQAFRLNADRNVVTNLDSDEVSWIFEDFKAKQWPKIEAKYRPYRELREAEEAAIEAIRKAEEARGFKEAYDESLDLDPGNPEVLFAKTPRKEADTSHLFAMMVQSGQFRNALAPVHRFGRYIDASTDVLVEDSEGQVLLVEVETSLRSLFKHRHPMDSYDLVVVWSLGGLGNADTNQAPWGKRGDMVTTTLVESKSGWFLKWGTQRRPVIVLSEALLSPDVK